MGGSGWPSVADQGVENHLVAQPHPALKKTQRGFLGNLGPPTMDLVAVHGGGSVGVGIRSGGVMVVGWKSGQKVLESQAKDTYAQQRTGQQVMGTIPFNLFSTKSLP